MKEWTQDFSYSLRLMARRPGFALTVLLTFAAGVGATTAMFSLTDQVILKPLPYRAPENLVMIWESNREEGLEHEQASPVNFVDYRGLNQAFEDMAGWWRPQLNLTDPEKEPLRVQAIEATSNFFEVLGVYPVLGGGFEAPSELFAAERQVVVSHRLWRSRFGADPDLIGKTLQLNDRPNLVVGVMPAGFHFPPGTDLWQRMAWNPAQHSRHAHFMEIVGRLREGISLDQANRELAGLTRRLETEHPDSNKAVGARAVALHRELVGVFHEGLLTLFAAVGLLLLLACANVANMLLARGSARRRELAVRAALGASRSRIGRLLLTESLTLALAGGAVGAALAWASLKVFLAARLIEIPRLEAAPLDGRVLAFALAASLATALLAGFAPALQLSRTDLNDILKEEGRSGQAGAAGGRLRGLLVVLEVALSVVLLVGSGLLVRSFWELSKEDPGFDPQGIYTVNLEIPTPRDRDQWPAVALFFERLMDALNAHPRIDSAAAVNFLPLEPGWRVPYLVKDRPPLRQDEQPEAQYFTVTPGYFGVMGVRFLAGRDFDSRDRADSAGTVIVNQTLARRAWPEENPIDQVLVSRATGIGPLGRVIKPGEGEYRVIGVVEDLKNNTLQRRPEPAIFFASNQFAYKNMNIVVRGEGGVAGLGAVIKAELRRLDPNLPLPQLRTMSGMLGEATSSSRFLMLLMCGFATLALALAALGIYGVLSYSVSERTQEIGIRMALGAGPARVMRLVIGQAFGLVAAGTVIGGLAAWGVSRLAAFATLLYKTDSSDWLAFAGALLILAAAALLACQAPARRAASVDPIRALRN